METRLLIPRTLLQFHRSGRPFHSQECFLHGGHLIHPFAFWLNQVSDHEDTQQGPGSLSESLQRRSGQWPHISCKCSCVQQGLRGTFLEVLLQPSSAAILGVGLQRLRDDHESGARKLAADALGLFQEALESLTDPIAPREAWWDKALHIAWHIWKNGRPSMGAAILSFELLIIEKIEAYLDGLHPFSLEDRQGVWRIFTNVQDQMRQFTADISRHFATYTRSQAVRSGNPSHTLKTLTLSSSSTIRECIVQAALVTEAKSIEIRLLESRPLFEGVSMATSILNRLEECGHKAQCQLKIFTDAQMAVAAKYIDFLLLGADRIGPDGSVSNKTGSLPAALCVRHISPKAKIIVASEIYKVAPDPYDPVVPQHAEENARAEVVRSWYVNGLTEEARTIQDALRMAGPCRVDVRNAYFERLPPSLIDVYICEKGVVDRSVFREYFQQACQRYRRYFGDVVASCQ